MSIHRHHRVHAYFDAGNFIARCGTCRWNGPWQSERQDAVNDAVFHLAETINPEDVATPASGGRARYSRADYVRWLGQHTRRLARDRARAAEHRDPVDPTDGELFAERRLREYLQALERLTYRELQVLRRSGAIVLSTINRDIGASVETNRRAVGDLERRMRHNDRCFPQIGLVAWNGRRHVSRLTTIAEDRQSGRHAYAWNEQQPEGSCVVCTCGVMVLGTLNQDFSEAEFRAARGHRTGRAWAA